MNRDIEMVVKDFVGSLEKIFAERTAKQMNDLVSNLTNGKKTALIAEKRTPDKLDALQDALLAFLKKNPGLRCEEIAKGMEVTTADLSLPIRRLGKKIKHQGVARGRRYWAR